MILKAYKPLLDTAIDLETVSDSKDLLTALSTKRQSIDKSIDGYFCVIRLELETKTVSEIVPVLGKSNLADIETKLDKPLKPAAKKCFKIDSCLLTSTKMNHACRTNHLAKLLKKRMIIVITITLVVQITVSGFLPTLVFATDNADICLYVCSNTYART